MSGNDSLAAKRALVPQRSPQPPRFIAIEGPLRVGKTTLARILAERLHARRIYDCEDNPFLADFYKAKPGAAFRAQMYFLIERQKHLREGLAVEALGLILSDFLLEKDRIFANLNLDDQELKLYERYYELLSADLPAPDLVIYLQAKPEVLRARIAKKASREESQISRSEEHTSELQSRFDLVCRHLLPSAPQSYSLSLHDALPISKKTAFSPISISTIRNSSSTSATTSSFPPISLLPTWSFTCKPSRKSCAPASQKRLRAKSRKSQDRKSTRLNSSHVSISYAVICFHRHPSPTPFPYTTLFRSRKRPHFRQSQSRRSGTQALRALLRAPFRRSPCSRPGHLPASQAGSLARPHRKKGFARRVANLTRIHRGGHARLRAFLFPLLRLGPPGNQHLGDRFRRAQRRSEEHTSELQSRFDLVCRL